MKIEEGTELLAEIRLWIETFGLNKYEVFAVFCTMLFFWRLPTILRHRVEIRTVEREFQRKSKVLQAKIEKEQKRRSGK